MEGDAMNAKYYMGDDDRDSLTAPDDCGCWSCGVDADTPCETDCECAHCQRARRTLPTLMTISEVGQYAETRGVAAKDFWAAAAGGDMTPVSLCVAAAICDGLLRDDVDLDADDTWAEHRGER